MVVTILGCGASSGVPHIIHGYGNSDGNNPKNCRTRSSILVDWNGLNILVDASPDLRIQFLKEGINKIDAVLLTHEHFDHTCGLPDLRPLILNNKEICNVYSLESVLADVEKRFDYLFDTYEHTDVYTPIFHKVKSENSIILNNKNSEIKIEMIPIWHGFSWCSGYRFENLAYMTDVVDIPEESFSKLRDLDTMVVDCLSYNPKLSHAHLEKVLMWIDFIKPKKAYLTHMDFSMDYDKLSNELPDNVFPCYDGLKLYI